MRASAFEFRFRFAIHTVIYILGFAAVWNKWLHLDKVGTWQWLAAYLSRTKVMSFSAATITVLVLGIVLALAAAALRTWGTAYLGARVVKDGAMQGERIVPAGPYRYLRNPLYLGTFLHTLALALLMLPSGAIFTIVLIGLFQLRLISAEEHFLGTKLGESYRAYRSKVPRLVPALTPRLEDSGARPQWMTAAIGEIYFWGVALTFLVLGWRYNSLLMVQGVLVSFGVSLVFRAFAPKTQSDGVPA